MGVDSLPRGAFFTEPADLMRQYFNGLPVNFWPSSYVDQSYDDDLKPEGVCG